MVLAFVLWVKKKRIASSVGAANMRWSHEKNHSTISSLSLSLLLPLQMSKNIKKKWNIDHTDPRNREPRIVCVCLPIFYYWRRRSQEKKTTHFSLFSFFILAYLFDYFFFHFILGFSLFCVSSSSSSFRHEKQTRNKRIQLSNCFRFPLVFKTPPNYSSHWRRRLFLFPTFDADVWHTRTQIENSTSVPPFFFFFPFSSAQQFSSSLFWNTTTMSNHHNNNKQQQQTRDKS